MRAFITGGAGYIGSHTILHLLRGGFEVMSFDNFRNSTPEAIDRVKALAGTDFRSVEGDICDPEAIHAAMQDFKPDAVVHFAGLKAVGESFEDPLEYYAQNVSGTVTLLKCMDANECRTIVFSSSATVYGESEVLPFTETHALAPMNPYGRTKLFNEEIIRDWIAARPGASAVLLRYFNPVGADPSGEIGEDPNGIPNNLMPFIAQVAAGQARELKVFGDDYATRDGTGERDYIHVSDLARAHVAALDLAAGKPGCEAINVGTGQGATVLEMIAAFEAASGRKIPYRITDRRPGDVARSVGRVDKAKTLLNWTAEYGIEDMCKTTWRWQSRFLKNDRP